MLPLLLSQEELLLLQPGQRLERTAPRPKPYESSGKLPDPFEGTREWLTTDAEGRPLLERQDVWGWVSEAWKPARMHAQGWTRHLHFRSKCVMAATFHLSVPYFPMCAPLTCPPPLTLPCVCVFSPCGLILSALSKPPLTLLCAGASCVRCRSPLCASTHPPLCRCLLWAHARRTISRASTLGLGYSYPARSLP